MTLLRQPGAPMPCPPLFPAAATTVTPLATAFFTADERDENDASQLDDVPPLSAGDVLRLMLMTFAPLLIAHCIPAIICEIRPPPLLARTLSSRNCTLGATPLAAVLSPAAPAMPATWVPCPLSSSQLDVPCTSVWHATILPANSGLLVEIPVSRIASR